MRAPPWRASSLFGFGPRNPLNRDQRGIMRQRLRSARLGGHITALHELVGVALLELLGADGRLDPAQETIARRAGCCVRTVSTAFRRLRNLGLLDWVQRLVRIAQQVRQTSNAYCFRPDNPVPPPAVRCERKPCREAKLSTIPPLSPLPLLDRIEAQAVLRAVAAKRQAAAAAAWVVRHGQK
jgi:AraC-like DNA-binding protein